MKLPRDREGELDTQAISKLVDRSLRVRTPAGTGRLCGYVVHSSTLTRPQRAGQRSAGPWLQVELVRNQGEVPTTTWHWFPARHVVRYRERELSRG